MAGDGNALIFTEIQVDVDTGKAQLKDFEKAADQTAKSADASAKKISSSYKAVADDGLGPLRDLLKKSQADAAAFDERMQSMTASSAGAAESMGVLALKVGVVSLAATAAVYAVDRFADSAEKVTGLSRGFETLTSRIGESADVMLGKAKVATRGLVSEMDLMKAANEAILLKLPVTAESFAQLAGEAVTLGQAMGTTPVRALDSMIEGLGRQSNRLLDNIGILVDAQKAYSDYAHAIGKPTKELTEAERALAFYTAGVEAARKATESGGPVLETFSEQWHRLTTAIGDTKDATLGYLDKFIAVASLNPTAAQGIGEMSTALAEAPSAINSTETALSKLGISSLETTRKVFMLREGVSELKNELKATNSETRTDVIRAEIAKLEKQIDSLLGKTKTAKEHLKALPFPDIPKEQQPFGGVNPFGKPTGTEGGIAGDAFNRTFDEQLKLEQEMQDKLLSIRIAGAEEWSTMRENLEQQQLDNQLTQELQTAQAIGADTSAIYEAYAIEQTSIFQKYSDARVKIAEQEKQTKMQQEFELADAIGGLINSAFGHSKAASLANAVINTYEGASKALAQGGIYGIALAAIVSAAGLAQVAKIQSTHIGSSGGASSSGGGAGGISFAGAIQTPSGIVGSSRDVTGTTPVITQSAPRQHSVEHHYHYEINVSALDARSFQQYVNSPEARRSIAEAVTTEQAKR